MGVGVRQEHETVLPRGEDPCRGPEPAPQEHSASSSLRPGPSFVLELGRR